LKKKTKIPGYIKILIEKYPKIVSGRKNFDKHHLRIINSIIIIKKYFNINRKV
tara:strand:+ start:311 stop:469 length:159 start_codon:yes stop_codon:yes gene_type:complete